MNVFDGVAPVFVRYVTNYKDIYKMFCVQNEYGPR